MKETAEQSAELKQALKHDQATDYLRKEAAEHPLEGDEAYFEVIDGHDTVTRGSWVAEQIAEEVKRKGTR